MKCDPGKVSAKRVLVVAPHPDDESLGCGGLIASLAQKGCRFYVVFTTDGGACLHRFPRKDGVRRRQ
jgi:LmbE family N-acetylglucosaminyl deacetylase